MKQLRTKVILSAFVLIFALVATIGSTFAWFTVATTVNVESMQLNVQSQDSLLIRMAYNDGMIKNVSGDNNLFDASQYKTTLTNDDIKNYFDFTAGGGWRLEPVTVVNPGYATGIFNGKTFSTLMPDTDEDFVNILHRALKPINSTTDINSNTGKVIQISFYLLSQGEAVQNVVLQDLVITPNTPGVAAQVVDAVRLSVWRAGYRNPSNGIVLEDFTAKVFGYTTDYDFAFTNANPTYYYTGTPVDEDAFNSLSDLSIDSSDWNSLFYKSTGFSDSDNVTGDIGDKEDAETILELTKNVPTLVTVTIFVEGWAAYTTNNIIASNFSISYKFSIYPKP